MPTKHRPLGNVDREMRDCAKEELNLACRDLKMMISPGRQMTEMEKVVKLKDITIHVLQAINFLVLMGVETGGQT